MLFRNKRPRELTVADIDQIVGKVEDTQLEFKKMLPCDGSQEEWDKNSKVSKAAKEVIVAELVGFANTDGGWLFLGVAEKNSEAVELNPLPKAQLLAQRLADSFADSIRPRLYDLEVSPIIIDSENGVIAIRVSPSVAAPHRNEIDNHFYRRVGTQTNKMSPQEIADVSVQTWKNKFELQERLNRRPFVDFERQQFNDIQVPIEVPPGSPKQTSLKTVTRYVGGFRCTALPLRSFRVSDIATNGKFRLSLPPMGYTTSDGGRGSFCNGSSPHWRPKLLGIFTSDLQDRQPEEIREFEISSDGLIEGRGTHYPTEYQKIGSLSAAVHARRFLVPFAQLIALTMAFRKLAYNRQTTFALDFEWRVHKHFNLIVPHLEGGIVTRKPIEPDNRLAFYQLEEDETVPELWDNIQREFYQSFGDTDTPRAIIDFEAAVSHILHTVGHRN